MLGVPLSEAEQMKRRYVFGLDTTMIGVREKERLSIDIPLGNHISNTPVQVIDCRLTKGSSAALLFYFESISISNAQATVNVILYNSTGVALSDTFTVYVSLKYMSSN